MKYEKYLSVFLVLFFFGRFAPAADLSVLNTVPRVDLERYTGTWYEVARLPNRFQKQCVGNVTADYAQLADGRIEVINRCLTDGGVVDEAHGVARVVEGSDNAKLEVSFVSLFGWNLFWGDYWILDLGKDYQYAVVGEPKRKYAWILSRTPELPVQTRRHIDRLLTQAGYDPGDFVQTSLVGLPNLK